MPKEPTKLDTAGHSRPTRNRKKNKNAHNGQSLHQMPESVGHVTNQTPLSAYHGLQNLDLPENGELARRTELQSDSVCISKARRGDSSRTNRLQNRIMPSQSSKQVEHFSANNGRSESIDFEFGSEKNAPDNSDTFGDSANFEWLGKRDHSSSYNGDGHRQQVAANRPNNSNVQNRAHHKSSFGPKNSQQSRLSALENRVSNFDCARKYKSTFLPKKKDSEIPKKSIGEFPKALANCPNSIRDQARKTGVGPALSDNFGAPSVFISEMTQQSPKSATQKSGDHQIGTGFVSPQKKAGSSSILRDAPVDKHSCRSVEPESPPHESPNLHESETDSDFQPILFQADRSENLIQAFDFKACDQAQRETLDQFGRHARDERPGESDLVCRFDPLGLNKHQKRPITRTCLSPTDPSSVLPLKADFNAGDFETHLENYEVSASHYKNWQKKLFELTCQSRSMGAQISRLWSLIAINEAKLLQSRPFGAGSGTLARGDQLENIYCDMPKFPILETLETENPRVAPQTLDQLRNQPGELSENTLDHAHPKMVGSDQQLARVPYVLGTPDQYVLVEFDREEPRPAAELSGEAQKLFADFLVVLKKVTWNDPVSQTDLDALTQQNRRLVSAVLAKKRLISVKERVRFEADCFNRTVKKVPPRREEESVEYAVSHIFKFLLGQFKKGCKSFRFRKRDESLFKEHPVHLGFYVHYFGLVADQHGWPISKFYIQNYADQSEPSKDNFIDSPEKRHKSISNKYIRVLSMSDRFVSDALHFLNGQYVLGPGQSTGIVEQYKRASEDQMIEHLNDWCDLMTDEERGLSDVLEKLEKSPKSKLPWSLGELTRAVDVVRALFLDSGRDGTAVG